MKGLTLTQPWASAIEAGAKRIETRSWYTNYRGELAIHAAKGFPGWAQEVLDWRLLLDALAPLGYGVEGSATAKRLPTSAIVATCSVLAVRQTSAFEIPDGHHPLERDLGDYTAGRFAWVLCDVRRLVEPVPCRGALGLWEVDPAIVAQIRYAGEASPERFAKPREEDQNV